jgi:hypothetical protein
MMSNVCGHRCSVAPRIDAIASRPGSLDTMAAAAPSPNSEVATTSVLLARSNRNASVHSSTATSSTVVPGRAAAKRDAIASPVTPPAQPNPKTGVRSTSLRKPSCGNTRVSKLGVMMPVDETVTTASTCAAPIRARSSADRATRANSDDAPLT